MHLGGAQSLADLIEVTLDGGRLFFDVAAYCFLCEAGAPSEVLVPDGPDERLLWWTEEGGMVKIRQLLLRVTMKHAVC